EQARGLLAVEVEDDAQRDDFALARRERPQPLLQLGGEALTECAGLTASLGRLRWLLALATTSLRAEPVERGRARDREEPGARRSSIRIEPTPLLERRLEGLARQVLGDGPVLRQVQEVPVDVVEEFLS